MMITITTSGGIGGFGLAKSAEVAVDALPQPLQVEVCARLDPAALGAIETGRARGTDRVVYHIVVTEEGEVRRFDLPESALPGETLDLIDQLLQRGAGR
jgi:hypothetical protein